MPLTEYGYLPSFAGPAGNLTEGRETMRSSFLKNDGKKITSKFESIIPLNLEIELEGISGLRAGDYFLIDKSYNGLSFIVIPQ